jgi:hypothetical protein
MSAQEITMAENTQPATGGTPEDESVLELQNLEGSDKPTEVEAHDSGWSVICTIKAQ